MGRPVRPRPLQSGAVRSRIAARKRLASAADSSAERISEWSFAEPGEHVLKGFDGAWRFYELAA